MHLADTGSETAAASCGVTEQERGEGGVLRTRGGLIHEDDGGVGHQLHSNGEPFALLH